MSDEPITITKDELRAISNLAHCVRNSKQNVGRRMLDYAESVKRICDRHKPPPSLKRVFHDPLDNF